MKRKKLLNHNVVQLGLNKKQVIICVKQRRVITHPCLTSSDYKHGSTGIKAWASYQIRKIAGCACAGNAGNVFPRRRLQRKPLVSDPGMHHGTCVTHVPRCMSGSFNCGDGENVPGIPGACAPAILRIWQRPMDSFLWNVITHPCPNLV